MGLRWSSRWTGEGGHEEAREGAVWEKGKENWGGGLVICG